MMTLAETAAALALATAHAIATSEGREVHSIKDLVCSAGCDAFAVRGGLCLACDAEVSAHYVDTIEAHSMITDDGGEGFALHCAAAYDDAEGAAWGAGAMPGKV
jgi:hypothetical protein